MNAPVTEAQAERELTAIIAEIKKIQKTIRSDGLVEPQLRLGASNSQGWEDRVWLYIDHAGRVYVDIQKRDSLCETWDDSPRRQLDVGSDELRTLIPKTDATAAKLKKLQEQMQL